MTIDPREFRRLDRAGRVRLLVDQGHLSQAEGAELLADVPILPLPLAEQMIENVVGVFGLPLAVVPGVRVNGREYLLPMVVEEPSVVAAQANAARIVGQGGGYRAGHTASVMIGQVQLINVPDAVRATEAIEAATDSVLAEADRAIAGIVRRGGGARGLSIRTLRHPEDEAAMLVVHLEIDTCDAMGANAVNTVAEAVAPLLAELSGGRVVLRILSNLTDLRRAWAEAEIPVTALAAGHHAGHEVADGIVAASKLAEIDPWRAATHNKGAMNGIDAVVLATGNDFRAVEAGAHAWAARSGVYGALSTWRRRGDTLVGRIELPLALGIVGGQTRTHPWVGRALRLLNVQSAGELAEVVACAGLGQNLTALRALASTGIQAGHMAMHARSVALDAGARPDEAARIAEQMRAAGRIDRATAAALISELRARS
jgi:hydroxymethylglutaryl-CoA reductase